VTSPDTSRAIRRQAIIIVATLATAYVASHFFRAANVTIGLDLMRDFAIGPEALGALTGAFFFGFSAMQIPVGFLFDRYGPRKTVAGMLVLATVGGSVFVLAPDWPTLLAGRVLMGAGFGVMLIGSILVMSIGLLGNLAATTPLAWGAEHYGWRTVFAGVVAFTFLGAIAVFLVVRDAPPGHPFLARKTESPRQMLAGLVEVLRNRRLHFILALNFCNYACTFTVQGLWGGPFLREVHGLSRVESGNVLLVAVIAYQIGMLTISPLDRVFDTRKRIAITGTLLIAAILATLAFWARAPLWVAAGAIVGIGFLSASSTMVMTHGRGIFPDRLIGRGIAAMNTSVMLGVACMQSLSGIIVGAFAPLPDGARSEDAYRTLFGFMVAVLLVAVTVYGRSRDIRPSDELRARQAALK